MKGRPNFCIFFLVSYVFALVLVGCATSGTADNSIISITSADEVELAVVMPVDVQRDRDPDDWEQPLPNPFPRGDVEPFPMPDLLRLVYSCPVFWKEKFGEVKFGDDLRPPRGGLDCAWKGAVVMCLSSLTDEERARCRDEFIPIAKGWVHEYFRKKPEQAADITAKAKNAIEMYATATEMKCEAEIGYANDLSRRFSEYLQSEFTYIGYRMRAALEVLTDQDSLRGIEGSYEENGVKVEYSADPDTQSVVAKYTYAELPEGLDKYLSNISGSSSDEFSVGKAHVQHFGIPYMYMPRINERYLQTISVTQPFSWERKGSRGTTGKKFDTFAQLPAGYKHCSTNASSYSSNRVCETRVDPSFTRVELDALVRGASGAFNYAKGWLRGNLTIRGIDESATTCEMERYDCAQPSLPYSMENLNTAKCNNSLDSPYGGRPNECKVQCNCVMTRSGLRRICQQGRWEGRHCKPTGEWKYEGGYCRVD